MPSREPIGVLRMRTVDDRSWSRRQLSATHHCVWVDVVTVAHARSVVPAFATAEPDDAQVVLKQLARPARFERAREKSL